MSIFDPVPRYRVAQPFESARIALDMPLTPLNNLWEQTQQGAVGLGTAIKDFATPRGVPAPTSAADVALRSNPIVGPLMQGYEAARSLFGAQTTGKPITAEEYKASPYFREGVPWDAGMTEDRAAAIATQFDIRQARQFFGQKDMVTTLAGGFLGSAVDPINYVPIFGQAARAAAVGKFGFVMGHGLLGASEAAINTAAFGVLTTPFRGRLGEDVSWEAAINNIAFSAVAGAAFGGIGGIVSKATSMRAAVAERDARIATETIQNLKDSRDVLNDAIASMVETGDVRLSPKSGAILERMAIEATDRRLAGRALDIETQDVKLTKPGEVVISPSGARVAVRPEVVEFDSLQKASGALQVRDRSGSNAGSNTQIQDIAINLDPARLMPNTDGSQGAPLVGADNIIDSGNGRAQAIALAYDAYPERSTAYRAALVEQGFPEAAGMQKPVLIQRRLTDLSPQARAQFNADLNGPTTARMSAVELAALDRNALTDPVLRLYNPGTPVSAKGNREFVAEFLAGLPLNERTGLVDPAGNLNADGVRRIENAMMAAAYGDVDAVAVRKFAEATDDNTRSIVGALADVAGKWISLRRAVQRGDISPDYDMTPELTEALRRLSGWREQAAREKRPVGVVIKEGLGQGDMLSGSIPAATKLFVRSFYVDGNYATAAGRDAIAERINDLADAALDLGQPDMLGDAFAATKLGVLKRVYNDIEADFFEAANVRTGDAQVGGSGGRSGPRANLEGDRQRTGASGGDGSAATVEPAAGRVEEAFRSPEEVVMPLRGTVDEQIAQINGMTEENLPIINGLIEEIDAALGTKSKANVKDPAKVVEKSKRPSILARKPWFTVAHVRDTLRFKTVISSLDQVTSAFEFLARAGIGIVKIDTGKLFDPKEWGWRIIAFDLRMPNGQLVEWYLPIEELEAQKKAEGHLIFEDWRDKTPEELDAQQDAYLAAIKKSFDGYDQAFGAALSRLGLTEAEARASWAKAEASLPEILLKSERSSGGMDGLVDASNHSPASLTNDGGASAMTSARSSPSLSSKTRSLIPADIGAAGGDVNARPPDMFNGSDMLQTRGTEGVISPVVDMQEPRPEPPPDGLDAAAARVGSIEDTQALAEQFGVDAKTGEFAEQADIDMLREQGRLTPEDEAELVDAERTIADADAYAETLRVAAACVMG